MAAPEEPPKEGAPAWMVSFGDMMTLILTFFILMVSLSKEQQEGLVAKGVGSFIVALRSFGLPGVLDDNERASIFEGIRTRFNLPPEADANRREDHIEASNLELIRAKAAQALEPHDELNQPSIALFEQGSSTLPENSKRYLDLLAPTLRPGARHVLLLEGHAFEPGSTRSADRALAFARARAVFEYLVEEHGFPEDRLEARAWLDEIEPPGPTTNSVDARLVIPARK